MNYTYDFHDIGKTVKNQRKARAISQLHLAELCGISDSHIRNIENGSANPSLDTLVKICNALEIPFERIISNVSASNTLTLSQIEILNGLTDDQQIRCLEILNDFLI